MTREPRRRLIGRFLPRWIGLEREVDDELAFHLSSRIAELIGQGRSREEAESIAREEFGSVAQARAELAAIDRRRGRNERRAAWLSDLALDFRFAGRQLRRAPMFTVIAAATIGLGIGANAAIFSVVRRVLIDPLPYREADRLVQVWESTRQADGRSEASYPDYLDWIAQSRSFEGLAGIDPTNAAVAGPSGTEMLRGARVTPNFFPLLGISPRLGRTFTAAEDVPGGAGVVLVSHGFWERRFGADRGILDSTLVIDRRAFRIIGVLPASFRFAPLEPADVWFPLDADERRRSMRFNHWVNVVGRLKPGVTVEQADADLDRVMAGLEQLSPTTNRGRRADVVPLKREFLGEIRPVVLALFGAVGLLLLIACANVANLLIARGLARSTELAVRSALGAHRGRLVRQLLAESVALAAVGGAVGVAVAAGGLDLLVALVPADLRSRLPALGGAQLDGAVLAYAASITLLTGILVGLLPASRAGGGALAAAARAPGSRRGTGGRNLIVATELALTTALLIGVGLAGRSLWTLLTADIGFVPGQVVSARFALAGPSYQADAAQQNFLERALEQVRAIPGVVSAGAVTKLPLSGGGTNSFKVEGQPEPDPATRPEATMRGVAGDYFKTLGIPLVAGRLFTTRDDSGSAPVMLINASLARQLFGTESALGRFLRFYAFPEVPREIVGVVGDVRTGSLDADPPPTIYYSHRQAAENRMTIVAKTTGAPSAAAGSLRDRLATLDRTVPVYAVQTLDDAIGASPALVIRRVLLRLTGALGGAALLLAMIGLYGVVAAGVAERTREFGIRLALGEPASRLLWMVVGRGAAVVAGGVAAGLALGAAAAQALRGLLYGISPADPLTYAVVAGTLMSVGVLASYLPAKRATAVPPITAIRGE